VAVFPQDYQRYQQRLINICPLKRRLTESAFFMIRPAWGCRIRLEERVRADQAVQPVFLTRKICVLKAYCSASPLSLSEGRVFTSLRSLTTRRRPSSLRSSVWIRVPEPAC